MTLTEFVNLSFFWGWWTFFEAVWIAMLWWTRTRVLGAVVSRMPGVGRLRRGVCEARVDALLAELERKDVPAGAWPDRRELVDRWHRVVAGRCVSVLLQAVPMMVVVVAFWWRTSPLGQTTVTPFWMFAVMAGFGALSITLMAGDDRAAAVSDAAGVVTVASVRFLEMLLIPDSRRTQDSALEVHGKNFGRLCTSLRTQARHTSRTMPPASRQRVRATTERLISALVERNERYLFCEGSDREIAVHGLSWLVTDALRHSCRPRAHRDSLVIVDEALLVGVPEPDAAGLATEPLRSRLLAGAGKIAVTVGLLTGAVLFPGGGAVADLLGAAGLASVALVCPPLREALYRARELIVGGPSVGSGAPEVADEAPSPPPPPGPSRPQGAGLSAVSAGPGSAG
ncbi:hypothetical protein ACIPW5_07735 [Streptomyces sp. NPDC090077]|uniref:hypothetical protein n=1 Tax=Streptomyces sp. NPDC090077 TaxID=3365938 RepID=UPI00380CBF98